MTQQATNIETIGPSLKEHVKTSLTSYLQCLNGFSTNNLYQTVLAEVEEPLLEAVLDYTKGNQSKAAELLGISRGTLSKKLKTYNLH